MIEDEFRRLEMRRDADLKRELAVQHEKAVLGAKAEFGGRIKELEEENKLLKAQLENAQGGEWRRQYPLLSLVLGLIMAGKTREEIATTLMAKGFTKRHIAMLLRSNLNPPTDDALKKSALRLGK